MRRRPRKEVLALALALLALPAAAVTIGAISFHRRYDDRESLVSSSVRRAFSLHVPGSYDGSHPVPLVITLHGASLWGAAQMEISGWNDVADRNGFIVVYPSGENGDGPRSWGVDRGPRLPRDVRFIADLIDTLRGRFNIDTTRIYANGFSNGGGMSFVLSCTMPDRIAAVGLVGAAQTLPFEWCPNTSPVPMVDFHGTADNAAPYNGGPSWVARLNFPPVKAFADKWSKRNGCAELRPDTSVRPDVVRRTYAHCRLGADVVLYSIVGAGHTWPGGPEPGAWAFGRATQSINASEEMWTFFQAHPLRVQR
jgi:polyhydroxybutyrate depolymerase